MMRTLKQRVLITLMATMFAAACGMLAGYVLGCDLMIRLAENKLKQSATRTIGEADAASSESRSVLAKMNASDYPFCSDAEVAYFRNLIFQADYLKEAGRLRDGQIECSATLGRLTQPIAVSKPVFSQADGTKLYRGFASYRVAGMPVVSLQLNDSFIVFSPYLKLHRENPPMHYLATSKADPRLVPAQLQDVLPAEKLGVLTTDGEARIGSVLYATRCSAHYFNCVTEYISIPEVLQPDARGLTVCAALGTLIGACLGLMCSIMYRRNRSQEQQLRRAIGSDKLRVVYQPIVDLASERIVGAEALVRWNDEDGVAVGPDVFVKIAEEGGFVGEITRLVVRHTLRDFGETLRSHSDFRISVNVAAADLRDPRFLPMLDQSLRSTGVGTHSLAIEITESSTAKHEEAIGAIRQLSQNGHSVHIDDFGTGYSSLSYLHALSVDAIKIDRSFTQAIGTDAVTLGILPQILAMAEALKLQVIVEGVETRLQADYFATSSRPIFAQGWFFGRPVPAEEFHCLLASDEKKSFELAEVV
jgi:sensor c-di-GMP phosphodiesterase-like protein